MILILLYITIRFLILVKDGSMKYRSIKKYQYHIKKYHFLGNSFHNLRSNCGKLWQSTIGFLKQKVKLDGFFVIIIVILTSNPPWQNKRFLCSWQLMPSWLDFKIIRDDTTFRENINSFLMEIDMSEIPISSQDPSQTVCQTLKTKLWNKILYWLGI